MRVKRNKLSCAVAQRERERERDSKTITAKRNLEEQRGEEQVHKRQGRTERQTAQAAFFRPMLYVLLAASAAASASARCTYAPPPLTSSSVLPTRSHLRAQWARSVWFQLLLLACSLFCFFFVFFLLVLCSLFFRVQGLENKNITKFIAPVYIHTYTIFLLSLRIKNYFFFFFLFYFSRFFPLFVWRDLLPRQWEGKGRFSRRRVVCDGFSLLLLSLIRRKIKNYRIMQNAFKTKGRKRKKNQNQNRKKRRI